MIGTCPCCGRTALLANCYSGLRAIGKPVRCVECRLYCNVRGGECHVKRAGG